MNSVRQILSIHIISQVGYMVMAVALGMGIGLATENRELALAGGIFFILHNMVVKSSLFLCGGLMQQYAGTDELDAMGGLARRAPWLAVLFFIAALSLAGLPPFSGFFAKFVLIREAMRAEYYALAGVALATSVLTLLSMVKIWSYAFWSRQMNQAPAPADSPPGGMGSAMVGTALLVVVALAIGLGAEPVMRASHVAARGIVDPSLYINAVLGTDQIAPVRLAETDQAEGSNP
jgi:multicomponent Na+:H+ antiporter subunit D